MENIQISFHMSQPVINRHFLSFDSLLSRAMFNATNSVEKALNELPLKRTADIYHASSMRLLLPVKHVPVDFVAGLRGEIDLCTDHYEPDGRRYKKYDDKRGDYKAQLDKYSAQFSREVIFYAVGDPEQIDGLMPFIDGIGKKTNQGVGGFHRYVISSTDEDMSLYHKTMKIMRPIPKEFFSTLLPNVENECFAWDRVAYKGPYWDKANVSDCYVPISDRMSTLESVVEFDDEF